MSNNIITQAYYTTLSLQKLKNILLELGLEYDLLMIYQEIIKERFDRIIKNNTNLKENKEFFFTHGFLLMITPKITLVEEAFSLLEMVIAERELAQ